MNLNSTAILNLSLIVTHQIDAAYWHEWDMFQLPGGIQLFNVLNLIIFIALLACFQQVVQRSAKGFYSSLVMAVGGSLIFVIHTGFALSGYTQFNLPFSIAVIIASLPIALLQLLLTLQSRSEFKQNK